MVRKIFILAVINVVLVSSAFANPPDITVHWQSEAPFTIDGQDTLDGKLDVEYCEDYIIVKDDGETIEEHGTSCGSTTHFTGSDNREAYYRTALWNYPNTLEHAISVRDDSGLYVRGLDWYFLSEDPISTDISPNHTGGNDAYFYWGEESPYFMSSGQMAGMSTHTEFCSDYLRTDTFYFNPYREFGSTPCDSSEEVYLDHYDHDYLWHSMLEWDYSSLHHAVGFIDGRGGVYVSGNDMHMVDYNPITYP